LLNYKGFVLTGAKQNKISSQVDITSSFCLKNIM